MDAARARQLMLDHSSRPRNSTLIHGANRSAEASNPLCNDHVRVEARVESGRIVAIGCRVQGCPTLVASASMMTEQVEGRVETEVLCLHDAFLELCGEGASAAPAELGELIAFASIAEHPTRVDCATLCWRALVSALSAA